MGTSLSPLVQKNAGDMEHENGDTVDFDNLLNEAAQSQVGSVMAGAVIKEDPDFTDLGAADRPCEEYIVSDMDSVNITADDITNDQDIGNDDSDISAVDHIKEEFIVSDTIDRIEITPLVGNNESGKSSESTLSERTLKNNEN